MTWPTTTMTARCHWSPWSHHQPRHQHPTYPSHQPCSSSSTSSRFLLLRLCLGEPSCSVTPGWPRALAERKGGMARRRRRFESEKLSPFPGCRVGCKRGEGGRQREGRERERCRDVRPGILCSVVPSPPSSRNAPPALGSLVITLSRQKGDDDDDDDDADDDEDDVAVPSETGRELGALGPVSPLPASVRRRLAPRCALLDPGVWSLYKWGGRPGAQGGPGRVSVVAKKRVGGPPFQLVRIKGAGRERRRAGPP